MKTSRFTIRLEKALKQRLAQAALRRSVSRSEFMRYALRRHLGRTQLNELRRCIMPLAAARGYFTDDDIFRHIR